jgi:toxin-antitoxin system PIN domain toxin
VTSPRRAARAGATRAVALLDANVLIALAWPQHVHHAAAHDWFGRLGKRAWATCPITQLAFVRISSNPRVIEQAVSPRQAGQMLAKIVKVPGHTFLPCDLAVAGLPTFSNASLAGHRQVTDAYLLDLARHHRGTLVTLDRGVLELVADAGERARRIEFIGAPGGRTTA